MWRLNSPRLGRDSKPKPRHYGEIRKGVPDDAERTRGAAAFNERALKSEESCQPSDPARRHSRRGQFACPGGAGASARVSSCDWSHPHEGKVAQQTSILGAKQQAHGRPVSNQTAAAVGLALVRGLSGIIGQIGGDYCFRFAIAETSSRDRSRTSR